MAYVQKAGSSFAVRKGNSGEVLSRFGSKAKAEAEVAALHKKYHPKPANRGTAARKRNDT